MDIANLYLVFRNNLGVVDAINKKQTGELLPLPLEDNENNPLVVELRAYEADFGKLDTSDREPDPVVPILPEISFETAAADPRLFGDKKTQRGSAPCQFLPTSGDVLEELDDLENPIEDWIRYRNYWVSKQVYYLDSLYFAITGNTTTFASIDKGFPGSASPPNDIWLIRFFGNFRVTGTNDSKHYWRIDLNRFSSAGASTTLGSFNTQGQGNLGVDYNVTLNLHLDIAALKCANFSFGYNKISAPGTLSGQGKVLYRKVRI
jgi:hypothetical protein